MKIWIQIILALFPFHTFAEFSPHEVMPAAKGKQDVYVMDAIIRGGDSQTKSATLSNIRWAKKGNYERIVLDIEAEGAEVANMAPPYFQVGLNPTQKKISLDIRNIANRKVTQENLDKVISRSSLLRGAYMAPKVEGELASLDFIT